LLQAPSAILENREKQKGTRIKKLPNASNLFAIRSCLWFSTALKMIRLIPIVATKGAKVQNRKATVSKNSVVFILCAQPRKSNSNSTPQDPRQTIIFQLVRLLKTTTENQKESFALLLL
jgi:hypothetical protein